MSSKRKFGDIEDLSRTRRWQLLRNMDINRGKNDEGAGPTSHQSEQGAELDFEDPMDEPSAVDEDSEDSRNTFISHDENSAVDEDPEEHSDRADDLLSMDELDVGESSDGADANEEHQEEEAFAGDFGGFRGRGDAPLYEGAPLTLAESMLAILSLSIVHNLTGSCLSDILALVYIHCRKPTLLKNTLHTFRKYFEKMKSPIIRHFYCSDCLSYLDNQQAPCSCDNRTDTSYFIEIPILHQLKSLFARKGFYEDLQHRFNRPASDGNIKDIYDGALYRKLFKPGRFLYEKNNISLTWYSDGIPIFKSKKYSLWPIYLVINELPYSKRILQQNIVVAGLWFGPKDPLVNMFLKPIHAQFQTLTNDGIAVRPFESLNPITVKATIIYGTADTPARSDFLCHTRFNGNYGCTVCNAKGYTISGEGYGNTHIYPFEGVESIRTQSETDRRAEAALECGRPVFGVKGPSLISKIMPDATKGVCIDVMHCVFLGVVKKLVSLWFDVKFRFENFSLYQYLNVVDKRLANLKPPVHVQRLPRSIAQHAAFFKASEYKNWFFYYSLPVVHDIMDPMYFEHYMKLVMGIYLLSTDTISEDMLALAEELLLGFVAQFQALYDARFLSINIHLLRHLPRVVNNSGPLWVMSCFPFEDLNGKIVRKIHGTTHIGLQVYSSVAHSIMLPYLVSQLPESESKSFCVRLLDFQRRQAQTRIGEKTYVIGRISECTQEVPVHIRQALENDAIDYEKISLFYRLKRGKQLFSSTGYSRSLSHINHCVLVENEGQAPSVGIVTVFVRTCQCTQECNPGCSPLYFALVERGTVKKCFSVSSSMIIGNNNQLHPLPFVFEFTPGNSPTLEPVQYLKRVCFLMGVGDRNFVAMPVNLIETE